MLFRAQSLHFYKLSQVGLHIVDLENKKKSFTVIVDLHKNRKKLCTVLSRDWNLWLLL